MIHTTEASHYTLLLLPVPHLLFLGLGGEFTYVNLVLEHVPYN